MSITTFILNSFWEDDEIQIGILPSDLPNLRNWILPASITHSAGAITEWRDISQYSQSYDTFDSVVTGTLNGHLIAVYDSGSDYGYRNADGGVYFDGPNNYTWMCVFKMEDSASNVLEYQAAIAVPTTPAIEVQRISANNMRILIRDNDSNNINFTIPLNSFTGSFGIMAWTYNNSTRTLTAWKDGVGYSGSNASINMEASYNGNKAGVGCGYSGGAFGGLKGGIAERFFYSDVKTNSEINQLAQRLANVYNVNWIDILE